MKKIATIMFLGVLLVGVTTGCGCKKKDKDNKDENKKPEVEVSTNEGVIGDKEVDVFKFENTSLIYENGTSVLETMVTNTSDTKQTLSEFLIHVKDKEGKEIIQLVGFVGESIDAHESKLITSSYGDNLTKVAYDITYEVKK